MLTVAQLKEAETSACEGKGQTELGTLSLRFVLAELGRRVEITGFGIPDGPKAFAVDQQISPFDLSHLAFLGPANQARSIADTHYYHSSWCPVIILSHLLSLSTF